MEGKEKSICPLDINSNMEFIRFAIYFPAVFNTSYFVFRLLLKRSGSPEFHRKKKKKATVAHNDLYN